MKTNTHPLKMDHIGAGVCYYAEHWGPSFWKNDLRTMKKMGLEAARVGEFAWNFFEPAEGTKLGPVAGKPCICRVGILQDYLNVWDAENDVFLQPLNQVSLDTWFQTLQRAHIPFDFVDFRKETGLEATEKYRVLIAPHNAVLTQEQANVLESFVAKGGILILGARSGTKNMPIWLETSGFPFLLRWSLPLEEMRRNSFILY